jgi:hypothetical protein
MLTAHAHATQSRFTAENLRRMSTALQLAQKMGARLGNGALLQRSLSKCTKKIKKPGAPFH